MSDIDTIINTKIITILAAASVAADPTFNWSDFTMGQPWHVIFFASVGSFVGVWNNDYKTRRALIKDFLTSFVITVGAIVVVPELSGYRWPNANFQAAMAMLMGFTSQTWGPKLADLIKERFFSKESPK